MNKARSNDQLMGAVAALGAYFLWGILPIYWKWIVGASSEEVIAHRVIWSFVFMIVLILITKNVRPLIADIKALISAPKRLLTIISASLVITLNWYIFIWSVDHGHVIQASLGYYINPLVSVLLGLIFLKEKLSLWQGVSFFIAFLGVFIMTIQVGVFPWISLGLAFTFGLYGLLKKTVHLKAMTGLTIETAVVTPLALLYLLFIDPSQEPFHFSTPGLALFLMGAGVVTAVPLILFAAGANRISLTMIGFFQYIAPTLMLILGTLLYHEPFDLEHLFSFIMIWLSLVLFTLAKTKVLTELEGKLLRRKSYAK
ncbi:MAG: EamA family transporter RarD [Tuberibacillus sp.]